MGFFVDSCQVRIILLAAVLGHKLQGVLLVLMRQPHLARYLVRCYGSHLAKCGLGRGCGRGCGRGLPNAWHLDPSSRLGRLLCPLWGKLGPHLTQYGLGWYVYLRTKWHLDPTSRLVTTNTGRK